MASPAFARTRAARIVLDRALSRSVQAADPWPFDNPKLALEKIVDAPARPPLGGANQVAAADRDDNMAIFAVPTLVAARDGRAAFGAAGSGGYRITTGVLHPLMHVIDFGPRPSRGGANAARRE